MQNLPKSRLLYNIRDHLLVNTTFAFIISLMHALTPQHIIDDLHVRYPFFRMCVCVLYTSMLASLGRFALVSGFQQIVWIARACATRGSHESPLN